MELVDSVNARVKELAPTATRLVVAVSGGADSVAALRLLQSTGIDLVAAHLDHALREGSAADASFVRELCASLGIDLVERRVDVAAVALRRGWNIEDAARRVRYSFLHRVAADSGSGAIVVAHTLDDQAETFLLQALRGAAYPSGMPARRGMVLRPLLGVRRDALRAYLDALGQSWREDPSNRDVTRSRAWLRSEVMPVLERRYPAAAVRFAATAERLADARAAIDDVAAVRFGDGPLRVSALMRAPVAVRRSAVAALLERSQVQRDAALIDEVLTAAATAAADPAAGPWRRSVGDERVVRVAYGSVDVVGHRAAILAAPVPVTDPAAWRALVARLSASGVALPDEATVAALAAEHEDLVLRHRQDGDRVRLPGGGRLLSDLLIDRKVPREERDALLLLASGHDVAWVAGVALDGTVSRDERCMRLALDQARLAAAAGELPVGAVLVRGGDVLAAAHNRSEASGDPSAHAELEVMRAAGTATGDWRLTGTTLYVTLEPCPMCLGAVLQTRVERVVFGTENRREGALGGVMDLRLGPWKRVPAVAGGVLEEECGRVLSEFFASRRSG